MGIQLTGSATRQTCPTSSPRMDILVAASVKATLYANRYYTKLSYPHRMLHATVKVSFSIKRTQLFQHAY